MLPFYKCVKILVFYNVTVIIKVINLLAVHRRQGTKHFSAHKIYMVLTWC